MKKEITPGKDSTNATNIEGIPHELAKNYDSKRYDPIAKFEEQFSFLGNPVIPNLSGEYLAFEDLSDGKYHIKLWHVRSGAVFEVLAGLALNAPAPSKLSVPNVPANPKTKR
jgi:hypothetical protein